VALANKIAANFNLTAIVVEQPVAKKANYFSLKQIAEKILNRTFFLSIHKAWFNLLKAYKKEYPSFPGHIQKVFVRNINVETSVNFIKMVQPDLVMVSGTSLLKNEILRIHIPKGIINLHTGLSPYIKGGPNCTNWCIAEEKFHLIGNTIMWINAGIDSGDIITTELTPLSGKETLSELHMKVMNHAHELYLKVLKKIQEDITHCPKVKQDSIVVGTTYFKRQWNNKAKWHLFKNLKKMPGYFQSEKYIADRNKIKTVPL
jgi:folate-dependent phosphoribosylglycinamide formyltransferase PurN